MRYDRILSKKYFLVAKNTWDEMLTYRISFVMWRVRMLISVLALYFLWQVAIPPGAKILDYNQTSILTYILGTSIISSVVISNRSYAIADEINSGALSNFLLKPMNYFSYWFAKDLGDKAMNFAFSIVELTIVFLVLKPPLFVQTNPTFLLFFGVAVALALIMYFLFNLILGMVGFWSAETWAPRFIFITLLTFLAGGIFPLDILPKTVFAVIKLLPFAYLLYFPLKIYLGQLPVGDIFFGLSMSIVWCFALYFFVRVVWRRGLKVYTAVGS